ncbi:MAG: hypothetical protein ABMA13_11630 [Chthoniobacteraceae bacterium]
MFKPFLLLPLLLPLVWWAPRLGARLFRAIETALNHLARRPGRAVLVVGLASFVLSVILAATIRVVPPHTHDEFGYLLIADTFSHGRVTNPPHAHWPHFESVHVLQQPTYTSKYPPAQGLALAIGQLLARLPMLGVWLTCALASATVCWMLMAWMKPRWAIVGGLLTAFHPQMIVWSQDYWGGAVALAGGAIVLGAFRRILREPKTRDAIWLGLGMAILANSRPYEGFVFSALVCATLAVWFIRRRIKTGTWIVDRGAAGDAHPSAIAHPRSALRTVILPWAAIMVLLAAQIGYYNARSTGSALRMPYVVCEATYGIAPLFIFQSPKPEPTYRHAELRALQHDYLAFYRRQVQSGWTLIAATVHKIHIVLESCLWSRLLLIPLLAAPWAIAGDRWLRLAIPGGLIFSEAMLLGTWVSPHYAAPGAAIFIVLVVTSMRWLKTFTLRGRRVGQALLRGTLCLCALSSIFTIVRIAQIPEDRWDFQRARLLRQLDATPDRNLVFVRYQLGHNPHREWVYNSADIDSAHTVLARILSPRENAKLREYFRGHRLWMLEADAQPATLVQLDDPAQLPPVAPPR